jgi:flagellar hook-length control protein FliK
VASVAADTSAISPPLPPASRLDPTPPAGASGTFADLLDASTPAAAPAPGSGPSGTSTPSPPGAANQGQDGATASAAAPAASATVPAGAVSPTAGTGKDGNPKSAKGAKDSTGDDSTSASGPTPDATTTAALAVMPMPIDPLLIAAAAQSPPPPSNAGTSAPAVNGVGAALEAGSTANIPKPADPTLGQLPAPTGDLTSLVPATPVSSAPSATAAPAAAPPPVAELAASSVPSPPLPTAPTPAPSGQAPADTIADPQAGLAPLPAGGVATPNAGPPAPTGVNGLLGVATPPTPVNSSSAPPPAGTTASSAAKPQAPLPPAPAATLASADTKPALTTPVAPPLEFVLPPAIDPAVTRAPADAAASLPPPFNVKLAAVSGRPTANDATGNAASDGSLASAGTAFTDATSPGSSGQPNAAIQPGFNPVAPPASQAVATWTAPHAASPGEAVPLAAVPIVIAARVEAGEKQFQIRLDPPDLGRIDVQLNVDSSGRATSHLVVDRADTLDLLRRDAPSLERALQSAGLTTDDGSLQFSLRDQSFAGRDQGTSAPVPPSPPPAVPDADLAPIDAAVRRYGQLAGLGGGIDIRV